MKMPNNDEAFVDDVKIDKYLLSETHIKGKNKAAFFKRFGFNSSTPEVLKESLLDHAKMREIINTEEGEHGTKYVLKCELQTPDERNPCVKSVWIIGKDKPHPRLITAYPND